jgi:hypothetical protein
MIMSSFLMNPAPYAEPKFPPNEEYSHNNYIPSQVTEDFYRTPPHGYGFTPDERRYASREQFVASAQSGFPCASTPPLSGIHTPTGRADSVYNNPQPPQGSPEVPSPGPPPQPGGGMVAPPSSTADQGVTSTTNTNSSSTSPNTPVLYPWMRKVHMGNGKSS